MAYVGVYDARIITRILGLIMAVSPILYLFRSVSNPTERSFSLPRKMESFSNQLNQTFVNFQAELEKIKLRSVRLSVKELPLNINHYKGRFVSEFAQVEVCLAEHPTKTTTQGNPGEKQIEFILIYADGDNGKTRFTVIPSYPAAAYNIKKDPDAKVRTEALEVLVRALFIASKSDIAITTSDGRATGSNILKDPQRLLPESKYTLFRAGALPKLEKNLSMGEFPIGFTKNYGDYVGISVTDQPFSLSSYNSDGSSPGMDYYHSVLEALSKIKKGKS